jgi:N-acetylneuraminate synthase
MITDHKTSKGSVYIIAEAGVNHNGSIKIAKQLIDVAVNAGADAVKFQTFKADKVISKKAPKAEYQKKYTKSSESQLEMVKRLELDEKAHWILIEHCKKKNIQFLSTPFDFESLHLLTDKLDLPCLKFSSGDITNGPLLLKAAQTMKPIILSTGMSVLGEIEEALSVLAFGFSNRDKKPSLQAFKSALYSENGYRALQEKVTLLHCTTEYPAPFEEVNLRAMQTLQVAFGLPVGFSDHTMGTTAAIAAVALGAVIIEKHITLNRDLAGPDHKASLEPDEIKAMVMQIRNVEKALGDSRKKPAAAEMKNLSIARKSIVASKLISKGELLTDENMAIKRPGIGLSPMEYWALLGRKSCETFHEDDLIF